MNGSIKHNELFAKKMSLEKLQSGFGPACFFLMGALHNKRFSDGKKVVDQNIESYLPNLKRALVIKNQIDECRPDFENPIVLAFDLYDYDLFNFHSTGWTKIDQNNVQTLDFPSVNVVLNQELIFEQISDDNIYWGSIGPYEVKAASKYLNRTQNPDTFFEAQVLDPNSNLYSNLAIQFFDEMPLTVIRLRIPSSHKNQGFNSKGYKVYIFYNKVLNFENGKPENFELANCPIYDQESIRNHPNYYFKYTFPFSFCTCKSGRRTLGFCAHRMAAIMLFGSTVDFNRKKYRALDSLNFEPVVSTDEPELIEI